MTDEQTCNRILDMPQDHLITPAQCRAARALLAMAQEDLAKSARVASKTVVRFEKGETAKASTAQVLRFALERSGVRFLTDNGVSMRAA